MNEIGRTPLAAMPPRAVQYFTALLHALEVDYDDYY